MRKLFLETSIKCILSVMVMGILGCKTAGINRFALVNRHNVILTEPDPLSPLSLGNGEFAFTADVTGLQSFREFYDKGIPLTTMSDWGWHSFPNPHNYSLEDTYKFYDTHGRQVA